LRRAPGPDDNVALNSCCAYVTNVQSVQYSGGYGVIQASAVVRGVGGLGDTAIDVDAAWNVTLRYRAIASRSYNADPRSHVEPARHTFDLRPATRRNVDLLNESAPRPAKHLEERQEGALVAEAVLPASRSESRLSLAGIGSLFWAVRNPVQGWRVILPIQPDSGSDPSSEVKAWCRTLVREAIGQAACP
jgi:hypothetical protein